MVPPYFSEPPLRDLQFVFPRPHNGVPVRALHLTELQHVSKERPFDIAFVCVKSYDTAWATAMVKQYLAPGGFVASLQTCINAPAIAAVVGWGRTIGVIAGTYSGELHAPGEIRRTVPLIAAIPRRASASSV